MSPEIDKIKNKILPLLQSHDIKKAAFFGSLVSGKINKHSDIDILVELAANKSLLDLAALKLVLEKTLILKAPVRGLFCGEKAFCS